jgi:hypothetical protein
LFKQIRGEKEKIKVLFASGERAFMGRKSGFRDNNGTLILPLLSIERTEIDRTVRLRRIAKRSADI